MATTLKVLQDSDVTTFKTNIHEAIPVTGSLLSGTYGTPSKKLNEEPHIRYYTHGMFTGVHDYPYLSSSANHIFDLTFGSWSGGAYPSSSLEKQADEKINIYNQMAQVLVGHDASGSIRPFDHLAQFKSTDGQKMQSAIFVPFSRLLVKDEIEAGTFEMFIGTSSYATPFDITATSGLKADLIRLSDSGSSVYSNSPAGEYGVLYSASVGEALTNQMAVGLIYYQAGIAVLELSSSHSRHSSVAGWGTDLATKNILSSSLHDTPILKTVPHDRHKSEFVSRSADYNIGGLGHSATAHQDYWDWSEATVSASIDEISDAFRRRVYSFSFRNTTELNSTVYFCRANHNEFNYSSNPTYVNSTSKIRVKNKSTDSPISYITTVGLYSSDGALMATAKLSKPIKKSINNDFTIRVRLDY